MLADVLATLAPEERAEAASLVDELHERGYRTKEFYNELRPGARVRHVGHRYPEAYAGGTGVVLYVTEKDPSPWSVVYGIPDVEMVVRWDNPEVPMSLVAQYHVHHVAVFDAAH